MSVEKIKKFYIISHADHRELLLETLQKMGVAQIDELGENGETGSPPGREKDKTPADPDRTDQAHEAIEPDFDWDRVRRPLLTERRNVEKACEEIASAIEFLRRYIPERQGMDLLRYGPETITPGQEEELRRGFDHDGFREELEELEGEVKRLHARRLTLKKRRENLLPWIRLEVPLHYFCKTKHTRIRSISVPASKVAACRQAAGEAIGELWFMKVGETVDPTHPTKNIIVIYPTEYHEAAEKIIQDYDLHPAVLPCMNRTPAEVIKEIDQALKSIAGQESRIESRLSEMKNEMLQLKVRANDLYNSLERKKARELCGETRSTFILKGWIPAAEVPALENALAGMAPESDLFISDPGEGEQVPVILHNANMIRPYESVLNIYGKPDYHEIDPTPHMAVFFFIGFGYCLTDAGYGLILSLLFGFAAWRLKLAPGVRKFCWMMTLSGISAVILGALTGGWFGNLFTSPDFPFYKLGVGRFLEHLKKIDPLGQKDILIFLIAALVIGFIQLSWGIGIKFYYYLSRGRFLDSFCDPFPWLLFSAGLVVSLFQRGLGVGICIAGLVLMILFSARENRNILLRLGGGLWSVYQMLTGLLSDVLSYSRLFALGLATGIMATVINIIAFILWPIPYVGWLLCLLLLLVAHPINLAINVLSAFIHTARLQFVEFFPKFYKSGGKAFRPFVTKREYIHVTSDGLKE